MGRAGVLVVAASVAISAAACGASTNDVGSGAAVTTTSTSAGTSSTTAGTTVGTTAPTDEVPTDEVVALDGRYALTGTQTCRMPGGTPDGTTSPLFAGSTLVFAGDTVVVRLRNEDLTVPVTVDGPTFEVDAVFDLSGNLTTGPPSPNDLPLTVDGSTDDGGATVHGTATDAGVNCTYTFTGVRGAGTPDSPTTSTSTSPPTTAADADLCIHIMDPATGTPFPEWTNVGPGLDAVHLVINCEPPWAEATFDPDPSQQHIVHWDGTAWKVTDVATFCSTYSGPKPTSLPGEGQPGNIWLEHCT